jgi:hypothetical protein
LQGRLRVSRRYDFESQVILGTIFGSRCTPGLFAHPLCLQSRRSILGLTSAAPNTASSVPEIHLATAPACRRQICRSRQQHVHAIRRYHPSRNQHIFGLARLAYQITCPPPHTSLDLREWLCSRAREPRLREHLLSQIKPREPSLAFGLIEPVWPPVLEHPVLLYPDWLQHPC